MFMMLAPVEKRESTYSIDSALDVTWTQVIHFRSVFQITTFWKLASFIYKIQIHGHFVSSDISDEYTNMKH